MADLKSPVSGKAQAENGRTSAERGCVVVGLGASAGGLEAYRQFLRAMPDDSGMAFVLIQHLDPDHESMMATLLSKHTTMPVVEVEDEMPIAPDHVYMIPPNRFISMRNGALRLDEPVKHRGLRLPIDHFFRSLAAHHRERAIGVVLTGTGSDGTLGMKDIKAGGGMVMVQQLGTAEYDGMPSSALSTGLVDFELPIAKMPEVLTRYARHSYLEAPDEPATILETEPDHYNAIIELLHDHTDYDFRFYKKGTLSRRTQRRMGLRQVERIADYLGLLRDNSDEIDLLFKDLLISVTAFFRGTDAWTTLDEKVLDPLVAKKSFDEPLRVWVPGCATGEEAYSIAMLLYESFERHNKRLRLQIFATDLDHDAIATARQGIYPATITADVTPERIQRFFREVADGFRISKRLREVCIFAVHNLIADPPFSNLDLVSCRNVLIYLESEVQQKVISMFHFALNPRRYLFLGSSESLGRRKKDFAALSRQWRIFRKVGHSRSVNSGIRAVSPGRREREIPRVGGDAGGFDAYLGAPRSIELARRMLLDRFVPASVLIDRSYEVHYFHGPVRDYLDIPTGEPTTDLSALCLHGLRSTLRAVVNASWRQGKPASGRAPCVERNGENVAVRIGAEPLPQRHGSELMLVSFVDDQAAAVKAEEPGERPVRVWQPSPEEAAAAGAGEDRTEAQIIEQLELEIQATREDLQSTIEELETANEELKASNEEVMSMNEELQSTNEELETSREELQSLNEELSTVNTQLEEKVGELESTNNDLMNLLTSTEIATIFLDRNLLIRRFTPATFELLRVIASDIGRPISDLAPRFNDPDLYDDARAVLDTLSAIEREVYVDAANGAEGAKGGAGTTSPDDRRWFIRRILPYRTSDDKINGLVLTFADVTRLKTASEKLERREHQNAVIARLGRVALAGASLEALFDSAVEQVSASLGTEMCKVLRCLAGNEELVLTAGVGWQEGLVGHATVGAGRDSQAGYTLQSDGAVVVEDLRQEKRFSGPPLLIDHGVVSGISVTIGPAAEPWGVLGAHATRTTTFSVDDTNFIQSVANVLWHAIDRQRSESTLGRRLAEIDAIYESAPVGLCYMDSDLRYVKINERLAAINGHPVEAHIGKHLRDILPDLVDTVEPIYRQVLETGESQLGVEINGSTGAVPNEQRHWLVSYFPLFAGGRVLGVNSAVIDITDRKRTEQRLLAADREKDEFIAMLAHELRNPLAAIGNAAQVFELVEVEDETLIGMRKIVGRQVAHMDRILDGLLDVSRIARGKIALERERVDLVSIVDKMAKDFGGLFAEKKIELRIVDGPESLMLDADPTRLSQCVGNLLSNALKFTDGGGEVEVEVARAGQEALVTVRDNGIGMERAFIERLFEPFRQADRSLHRTPGGLGLGLAMVKRLAELHGGSLSAQSDGPGKGSEFILRLPIEVEP